jgi:hypothetical protein
MAGANTAIKSNLASDEGQDLRICSGATDGVRPLPDSMVAVSVVIDAGFTCQPPPVLPGSEK